MALECVCVGDRLGSTAEYAPGPSTYVKDGHIYAKSIGRQQISPGEGADKPSLEVLPLRPREQIAIGSLVFARVERITPMHAHARILCVGAGDVLGDNFRGVVRLQDVRRTEIDKLSMAECFRPGDVVRAEVLSLGDARSYYLSTAEPELGVVRARCVHSGQVMVPISWQEFECPETHVVERRKVARVVELAPPAAAAAAQ